MGPARSIGKVLKALKNSSLAAHRIRLGKEGERAALECLRSRGYRILDCNYRTPAGELDIVAQDGEEVVFVEVKTRSGLDYGEPEWAVNQRKRRHLIRASLFYLLRRGLQDRPCRFDVAAVRKTDQGTLKVHLIPNAFGADG